MRPEVEIVPYRDGPYLVRGPVALKDQNGESIDAPRRTIALCRCGKSRIRPFCDGTHRLIRFRASSESERPLEDELRQPQSAGRDDPARSSAVGRNDLNPTSVSSFSHLPPDFRNGSQAGTARASLVQAQSSLRRLLERESSMGRSGAIAAAEPLVESAYTMLENLAERGSGRAGGKRAASETAPCLCLVQGALAALAPEADDSDDAVAQLIAQLRSAAWHLGPGRRGQ